MITRGKLIGEIIDNISQIQFNLETRAKLHLYDINTYCEEFAKNLLNKTYGYDLENLNEYHLNEPALDLGDKISRKAFQVTTDKSGEKINKTLSKITSSQLTEYDEFFIFILGKKQTRYTAIEIPGGINFSESTNIIDFNDVLSKIFYLALSDLVDIHKYVNQETPKIITETEIVIEGSERAESVLAKVEKIATPTYTNFKKFVDYFFQGGPPKDSDVADVNDKIEKLILAVSKLPRASREFVAIIFERSGNHYGDTRSIPYKELRNILPLPEKIIDDELSYLAMNKIILQESHQVDFGNVVHVELGNIFSGGWDLHESIKSFIDTNKISSATLFVDLNFTSFA